MMKKKLLTALILTAVLSQSGCAAAALGYTAYKLSGAIEDRTRTQAQVEREKIQLAREKAGL